MCIRDRKVNREKGIKSWTERIKDKFAKSRPTSSMLLILLPLALFYLTYVRHIHHAESFTLHIIFNLFVWYFFAYVIWFTRYMARGDTNRSRTSKELDKLNITDAESLNPDSSLINSDYIDRLVGQGESHITVGDDAPKRRTLELARGLKIHYPGNVLYEVNLLVDSGRFADLREMDFYRWCPTCLSYKAPKTKHCKEVGRCVPQFNHYSTFFGTPVRRDSNHLWYVLFIIQQTLVLGTFLTLMTIYYSDYCKSSFYFLIPEVMYQMIFGPKFEPVTCFVYILGFPAVFLSFVCVWIEIYGIISNLSFAEMARLNRYRYLFSRHPRSPDGAQQIFDNPHDEGIFKNVRRYISAYF
eukprot:TRINITY_DN8235_c0_g1_i1.p1 TRINITY_DN8235_c0_g1~~TRINITY_DN8235_c0_g1_i1.p1  ORF type:complete len:355 (-),score=73.15 TRINITY_DN8235_c0_g1_i1:136-1200(-)